MGGRLVVAVGDGLGHAAYSDEGRTVGNDRMASCAVVGYLPPCAHTHLRRVAGLSDRPADPRPVTVDRQTCDRSAEGGFLPCLPVVIPPPAAHGAVGELDGVIGEWVLLHGDTEDARAE